MSISEQVREWMNQQDDIIECPLEARMRLSTCQKRQKKLPPYVTDGGNDMGPSHFFGRCSTANCEHYSPPPKKKGRSRKETREPFRLSIR